MQKIEVPLPDSNRLTKTEVRSQISKKVNVPYKDILVSIKEQNIAIAYKFTIEYRGKNIKCFINIIDNKIIVSFPTFSKEEAMDEVRKLHPTLQIDEENVSSDDSSYIVNYNTEDHCYMFKVSKKSCKVLKEKVSITEKRAKQIARDKVKEDPFSIWKCGNTWNFYYLDGTRVIIDEESENVITKSVISSEQAETLARNKLIKTTGESDFSIVRKEFGEGKWFLSFKSKKWAVNSEIDENGKIIQNLRLQQAYCLEEAKKILAENKISETSLKNSAAWSNGWEFIFSSPFGECIVRIGRRKREFLKRNITQEGAKYFAQMEIGGEVRAVKDREKFWDIILKKQKRNYRVELNKQNGAMQIKIRKFIFWKRVDLNDVKKNAY